MAVSNFLALIVLSTFALLANAEYTKLQWSDCGSQVVSFTNIAVTPMPMYKAHVTFK